jgi:uncharacterized protein with PQ loop repeat
MKNEKFIKQIGWFASIMAVAMYISYIDQIIRNLNGHPGSVVLPVITSINCTAWVLYAWLPDKKDLPILVCNLPGVVLGIITACTAIIG